MSKLAKYFFVFFITFNSSFAFAQHRHNHHHHHHNKWLAPMVIGGIMGYAIANNQVHPQVIYQPPVYVEQPNVFYSCPIGTRSIFQPTYAVDRWGRSIVVNQFIGCH